jgi:hypothetical protein
MWTILSFLSNLSAEIGGFVSHRTWDKRTWKFSFSDTGGLELAVNDSNNYVANGKYCDVAEGPGKYSESSRFAKTHCLLCGWIDHKMLYDHPVPAAIFDKQLRARPR